MTPPRWVDSDGHPIPTRPCLRFGTSTPIFRMTVEDVKRNGWIIYMPTIVVHWCGHGQEVLPIPSEDGKFDLVPVIGEAW
jgi:hypothetical protein